jgi:hypothetical protein
VIERAGSRSLVAEHSPPGRGARARGRVAVPQRARPAGRGRGPAGLVGPPQGEDSLGLARHLHITSSRRRFVRPSRPGRPPIEEPRQQAKNGTFMGQKPNPQPPPGWRGEALMRGGITRGCHHHDGESVPHFGDFGPGGTPARGLHLTGSIGLRLPDGALSAAASQRSSREIRTVRRRPEGPCFGMGTRVASQQLAGWEKRPRWPSVFVTSSEIPGGVAMDEVVALARGSVR